MASVRPGHAASHQPAARWACAALPLLQRTSTGPQPPSVPAPAELVAIGSRSLEKAKEFVQELQPFLTPACKAYDSYDDVLNIQGLDAVSGSNRVGSTQRSNAAFA